MQVSREIEIQLGAEIVRWAEKHRIQQFLGEFVKAGFDTIEVLREIESSDLDWMNISSPGQRKKILIAVRALNTLYQTKAEYYYGLSEEDEDPTLDPIVGEEEFHYDTNIVQVSSPVLHTSSIQEIREEKRAIMNQLYTRQFASMISPAHGFRLIETNQNPLYIAVTRGDVQELKKVLSKMRESRLKIDINSLCGDSSSTVLHVAVGRGDLDLVKALLNYPKINHRVRDGRGRSVLLIALATQNVQMLKLLLDFDEKNSSSSGSHREQRNNKILSNNNKSTGGFGRETTGGWLLREMDGNNRTLLYLACCSNNISLVRALLNYIPHLQINQPNADAERHTPLFAAVTRCDVRLCQILLSEYGADPNIRDGFGCTPLICAIVDHESTDLVEVLLKYGANPSMQDANGITPLDIAASLGKKKLASILLKSEREQLKSVH